MPEIIERLPSTAALPRACPFCHSPNHLSLKKEDTMGSGLRVWCQNCDAMGPSTIMGRIVAISLWNGQR